MRTLLTLLAWPLRIVLFLLLAILASLNLHESTVFLFLGHQARAPMAVLLLIAFASGALLGVLAVILKRLRMPRIVTPVATPETLNKTSEVKDTKPVRVLREEQVFGQDSVASPARSPADIPFQP